MPWPYDFVDDGKKVVVSSDGHPATGLIHSSGELKWDNNHTSCTGEIEEKFTDSPHKWRSPMHAKVLDPNTLEVADCVLNFDNGEKKRVVLRYYRQK